MADDLLLFSLPCFCRGAAPIGAVVIRKVTEARPPSGSERSLILSGRRRWEGGGHEIRKNRARSRNCGNCIIATPFRRLAYPAVCHSGAKAGHDGPLSALIDFAKNRAATSRLIRRAAAIPGLPRDGDDTRDMFTRVICISP